jgi:hypothetical protein
LFIVYLMIILKDPDSRLPPAPILIGDSRLPTPDSRLPTPDLYYKCNYSDQKFGFDPVECKTCKLKIEYFYTKAIDMRIHWRFVFSFVLIGLFITGCVSETQKAAEKQLEKASGFLEKGQFEPAISLLDSIQVWFPEEYGVVGKAMKLRKNAASAFHNEFIRQAEEMRDSLLPRVKILSKNFVFEAAAPGRPGKYEHKRQSVRRSWSRSFVKANIREDGQFWISSHYYGKEWLDHVYIKVYDKELQAFSDTIPLGDSDNSKLQDADDKWETIDFKDGTDRGIVALMVQNSERRLKVRFSGKKHHYIIMEEFDKDAVRNGFELAQVLKGVHELNQKIERHKKDLRLLGVSEEIDSL